jgi:HTH-type transcriptional regulator/antitoxin HigA
MSKRKGEYGEVDRLLSGLFNQPSVGLRELFEQRIAELGIPVISALNTLNIEHRALYAILDGTQKRIDLLALARLATFLRITRTEAVDLLFEKLQKNFEGELKNEYKREFILQNFDLPNLVKCGFIDNANDFVHIEERIVEHFGFDSIYDYKTESIEAAFSSGAPKPKTKLNREFWIAAAANSLKRINNYYEYDRSKLLAYIPSIRWNSLNVKRGLFQVIRELFQLGVTVIYQPYLPTLYVRGATFAINDKPCIVLTNYTPYYPSLWFALMHELHHVLYDWEEIRINKYQVSGELDLFTQKEVEADDFAREYLFSNAKLERIKPHINNPTVIAEFAKANNIHPSIIYIFYCWDAKETDKKVWGKFDQFLLNINETVKALAANPWQDRKPIREIAKQCKEEVFNGI